MNTHTRLLAYALLALALSGCSGMRLVESRVKSTPTPAAQTIEAGARYRFERLPSQTDPVETDSVEAIAEAELLEVGLAHDQAAARYSVQITSSMESREVEDRGYRSNGGVWTGSIMIGSGGMYGGYGPYGPGSMVGFGLGSRPPPAIRYRHEVTLLLRDLQTNQVVYETSATHEGSWNDRYNILRAMLAAALKDFPNPPPGPRRVKVEIPR